MKYIYGFLEELWQPQRYQLGFPHCHAQSCICHCHPASQQISVTWLSATVHIQTQTRWIWFPYCFTDIVAWICCLWSCSRGPKRSAMCMIQEMGAIRYLGSLCSTACVLQPLCTTIVNPPTAPTRWAYTHMYTCLVFPVYTFTHSLLYSSSYHWPFLCESHVKSRNLCVCLLTELRSNKAWSKRKETDAEICLYRSRHYWCGYVPYTQTYFSTSCDPTSVRNLQAI